MKDLPRSKTDSDLDVYSVRDHLGSSNTVALVLNDTISDYKDDFQQPIPVGIITHNQQSMTR
jgi:hypothetical protein